MKAVNLIFFCNLEYPKRGFKPRIVNIDNIWVEFSNFIFKNEQLFACSKEGLIIIQQNNSDFIVDRLIPNTPSTGNFSAIEVLNDGRLVGGSGSGISIYNGIRWRNILEIKTSGTLSIGDHSDFNNFIADTVGYDFGEYIADIEQGPDGLVYCAIRGSRVYSGNPPRYSGGVIIIDVDDPNRQEKITPDVRKKYEEWKKEKEEHPDNTDFVSKVQNEKGDGEKVTAAEVGGLAARGQAHHEFVNPGNGEEPYYHYKDYAYASSDSKDPVEFPNKTDAAAAAAASAASGGSNIKDKYGENITGMSIVEVKIPYSEWTKEMKKSFHERTGTKPPNTNESYMTEGVGLGLYEPEAMNVDLADIRKGVMPEYPKKPPAEMIDGYHEKSPLKPKPLENEPFVKITKADLIRNHRLKGKEADEMMNTINMINNRVKKVYKAVLNNHLPFNSVKKLTEFYISLPIGRDYNSQIRIKKSVNPAGKTSKTYFREIKKYGG